MPVKQWDQLGNMQNWISKTFLNKNHPRGGSFPIQKFMLQIFAIIKGTSVMNFGTNPQHDFLKMRGGGQRPFGTFPKIHPFWSGEASLRHGPLAG